MISFGMTEEQELIRDTVREFALSEMRDMARNCDEEFFLPDDFLATSWELGLATGGIPEELGGGGIGRSPITNAIISEELAFGDAPLAAAVMAPSLFVNTVLDFGTDAQKKALLPTFTTSEYATGTLALHEPNFVFDPASLRTRAEPKGDGWRLQGAKRHVLLGDRATHVLVIARGPGEGLDGLEAFIVPRDTPGLEIGEVEKNLGFQAVPSVSLELDCELGADARLGGDAGIDGRRLVNQLRLGTVAMCVGLSRAIMETAIPYARERVAFGQPIAQKQTIAFMLAQMRVEVNSMRHLLWKAASQLEQGLDATKATTLALTYAVRETMKIADNGLQVFGGHGFIRDYPLEMWYRNARALTVLESVTAL